MIKRLFIESDVLSKTELRGAQRKVADLLEDQGLTFPKEVFDETVDFAWHEGKNAWEAVLRADEIYADSSLVPLCGFGSYTGSVVVMDRMMQLAIDQKIKNKSVIFLRSYESIEWQLINFKLLARAFKYNRLFTVLYKDGYKLMPVVIPDLIKFIKSKK